MLLLRILSRCPLWLLHGLGSLVGGLSWLLSPTYRARSRENLALAGLPQRLSWRAAVQAGRMLMELPSLWMRSSTEPLGDTVRWEGAELIAQSTPDRGLLLLTPHLGCFEVAAQAYAERFAASHGDITVLYRPADEPWMREMVENSRQREGVQTAPASLSGVRQMLRALRKGETVGLLPDQVPPEGQGAWATFFNKPAYTMTLAAKLVQQTNAQLLLIWADRLPWGRGYVVRVRPGPHIAADSSPESAARTINQAMESLILEAPEQYLWGYNRYKSPRSAPQS